MNEIIGKQEKTMMKMGKLEKLFVNSTGHSQGVAQYAEKLLRRVPVQPGQSYLDVGSGNGVAPIAVAQTFGLKVTGVDIDPQQIALAQAAAQDIPGTCFMALDGRTLPFGDGEFDFVFTNKVTHHIPNWQEALAEMIRVLKPGGYLLYSDLALPVPLARIGEAMAGDRYGFPNRPAIETFAEKQRLATVWQSVRPLHFTGIFRKES
jgi:ubiquinone/menaquinone biosynthesis C-methylase UbiE